eukprot:gene13942-16030_t
MFYNGPERYQAYEIRPPPVRIAPEVNPYLYRPTYAPATPGNRDFASFMQAEVAPRYRVSDPSDQSEELLQRLEQSGRVPSKDKFRRMACNTFIMTGACPYSDRCVFMHDFRIKAEGARVRTTRQTKADNTIKDTFYWPDMTRKDIGRYLDAQGLPDPNQRYVIPESFASIHASFHNRGLYSVWNHFVEFCAHNSRIEAENKPMERDNFFQVSDYAGNRHIYGTYRLSVFVHLSVVLEERYRAKQRPLESSFASGYTTRNDSVIPDSAYDFTSLNTTLNTPTKLSISTINSNFGSVSPAVTPRASARPMVNGEGRTLGPSLQVAPPHLALKQALPVFSSLVIQPPDDEVMPSAGTSLQQDVRARAYPTSSTPTNHTRSTATTPTIYSTSNGSYQVTPPADVPLSTISTNYPAYNNSSHTTNRVYSPRHPPSFATLRATTAASIGQYAPHRFASSSTSYDSPRRVNNSNNSEGAEYAAQRHYRPPTPRSIDNKRMTTNTLLYKATDSYSTVNPSDSRDAALYADLLGETAREGYSTTTHRPNPVTTSQNISNNTDRETEWSHVQSTSYDSGPLSNRMAALSRATPPVPVLPTIDNTTISSAITNTRSLRPVKTVNWADLNDSSSSNNSSISDSDNDEADLEMHRVQSEEWEQVGDYHSASSISNSSSDTNTSAPHHTTSVYDILQQAAAMSRDSTTSTLTNVTNTSDSELSPWADPTYLDLHLLGDSNDDDHNGMHDRGNIRALLGINGTSGTPNVDWSMPWAVSDYHNNNGAGFDDAQQLQETNSMDYLLDDLGLTLSPIQKQDS